MDDDQQDLQLDLGLSTHASVPNIDSDSFLDDLATADFDQATAEFYKSSFEGTQHENLALARLSLSSQRSKRAELSEAQRWAKLIAKRGRSLCPRPNIPASIHNQVLVDDNWTCRCLRTGTDVSIHIGHVLSLDDARTLTEITGDGRPWYLANQPEDYFAHCAKCNFGQGNQSFSRLEAMSIFCRPRLGRRTLRPEICLQILEWCSKAEEWRPKRPSGIF